ncbi:beta-1,6-N-acetylglucosaminyltransferase [bacterium]|nr:beta-1,6-N-acetylglucosaminyltransferase [bacterium]
MKHFVGILAHHNSAQIEFLCNELEKRGFAFAVHWDKKSKEKPPSINALFSKFKVYRGHISLVRATLNLMREAKKQDADYFHLISGEDFPVKKEEEFNSFFKENDGYSFLNFNKLPIKTSDSKRSPIFKNYSVFKDRIPEQNYLHRFLKNGLGMVDTKHYRPQSIMEQSVSKLTRFVSFQDLYHRLMKKNLKYENYYAGSAWFTMHKKLMNEILAQSREDTFIHFSDMYYPDEIYFQTLALNSSLSETVINSDLRYIPWEENAWNPSYLDETHIESMGKSNGFFARKLDLEMLKKLDL